MWVLQLLLHAVNHSKPEVTAVSFSISMLDFSNISLKLTFFDARLGQRGAETPATGIGLRLSTFPPSSVLDISHHQCVGFSPRYAPSGWHANVRRPHWCAGAGVERLGTAVEPQTGKETLTTPNGRPNAMTGRAPECTDTNLGVRPQGGQKPRRCGVYRG